MDWMSPETRRKVLVIGLDSAPPDLVFEEWLDRLDNLRDLIKRGFHGEIESTVPPITIPAWTSFATGKNPGKLGFFGFRNRTVGSYDDIWIANAAAVKEDTLWDLVSREGKKVITLGVPQTYPPKPVNGLMVSGFLAPDTEHDYTYPSELKDEIRALVGDYLLDVDNFRTEDKESLLKSIYLMTERRFDLAAHLMSRYPWDLFMLVEIGPDRIHHGFWKYLDPEHRKFVPGSEYKDAIRDYYIYLDREVGELLDLIDKETVVVVVSDHGAKRMDGCININDWLIQEGYLTLKSRPASVIRFDPGQVDWENTLAWGWGGYYGRLFLNVKGRESLGVVQPGEYEGVREDIAHRLRAIEDENGRCIGTRVFKPQEVYQGPHIEKAPDLIIYFGDLSWRSTDSVGHPSIHSFETELGPDEAVHDEYGIFIVYDPRREGGRRLEGLRLVDGAPTILSLMGLRVPDDMDGGVIDLG